ncbi:UPF0146 family protein [Halobellus rubicundus]|uniref:UPF0146 family protein n=1 Tax=Halobellus rubicundus TaxID=2996466 RepID=A0ABD5MB73_9EURY
MNTPRENALVGRFSTYGSAVEIGVGRRPDVAVALAEAGVDVTVTDVAAADELGVPSSLRFVRDDVVAAGERDHPGESYEAALVYGLNLPPELHRPTRNVARAVDADFLFTTLGYDSPAIPVDTESLPEGETLYVAREGV